MQVTSNEFALLAALASGAPSSRRALAARTGLSSGSVGRTLKAVEDAGLVRDGALTQTGFDALEPYRVRNAVVMAAGLSSRCAPISYEKPKGLLRVRGERLIERQIRQLREAGIEDVTVVVGYKKEEFFYLEDAFGVDIVVNEDFAVRNNHATLFQVRDLLGATYVCSSDNYFTENPFEPYAYESYCAAVYIHGETDEYCLGTRGKERRIVSAALGGRDSWALMGHAYWTPSFAEAFMSILEAEYDKPETAPKLWEEVFFSHADELKMVMRPYPADVVHEFDSLDQLQSFDPEFIDNVGSGVLDNICSTLGCLRGDIVDVRPLQQGLTNLSFYFSCGGEGYVYRHPGAGTDDIINRQAETFALKAASDLGLDETYVYEDPRQGWKIARFVPGCSEFDYADAAQVERALKMARRLHTSGVVSPWSFDFYDESKKIEGLLRGRAGAVPQRLLRPEHPRAWRRDEPDRLGVRRDGRLRLRLRQLRGAGVGLHRRGGHRGDPPLLRAHAHAGRGVPPPGVHGAGGLVLVRVGPVQGVQGRADGRVAVRVVQGGQGVRGVRERPARPPGCSCRTRCGGRGALALLRRVHGSGRLGGRSARRGSPRSDRSGRSDGRAGRLGGARPGARRRVDRRGRSSRTASSAPCCWRRASAAACSR